MKNELMKKWIISAFWLTALLVVFTACSPSPYGKSGPPVISLTRELSVRDEGFVSYGPFAGNLYEYENRSRSIDRYGSSCGCFYGSDASGAVRPVLFTTGDGKCFYVEGPIIQATDRIFYIEVLRMYVSDGIPEFHYEETDDGRSAAIPDLADLVEYWGSFSMIVRPDTSEAYFLETPDLDAAEWTNQGRYGRFVIPGSYKYDFKETLARENVCVEDRTTGSVYMIYDDDLSRMVPLLNEAATGGRSIITDDFFLADSYAASTRAPSVRYALEDEHGNSLERSGFSIVGDEIWYLTECEGSRLFGSDGNMVYMDLWAGFSFDGRFYSSSSTDDYGNGIYFKAEDMFLVKGVDEGGIYLVTDKEGEKQKEYVLDENGNRIKPFDMRRNETFRDEKGNIIRADVLDREIAGIEGLFQYRIAPGRGALYCNMGRSLNHMDFVEGEGLRCDHSVPWPLDHVGASYLIDGKLHVMTIFEGKVCEAVLDLEKWDCSFSSAIPDHEFTSEEDVIFDDRSMIYLDSSLNRIVRKELSSGETFIYQIESGAYPFRLKLNPDSIEVNVHMETGENERRFCNYSDLSLIPDRTVGIVDTDLTWSEHY